VKTTKQKPIAQPYERRCGPCGGTGKLRCEDEEHGVWSEICAHCGGSGTEWTDEGRNLMAFLRRNLKIKTEVR